MKIRTSINGKQTPTYSSWIAMIRRCTNPSHHAWNRYGGRGIKVCERWRTFQNFAADMGERPEGCTIDRIDNDGNYEPSNCRWAGRQEQFLNSTGHRRELTINGVTRCMKDWARQPGAAIFQCIRSRLRIGWTPEHAVFGRPDGYIPPSPKRQRALPARFLAALEFIRDSHKRTNEAVSLREISRYFGKEESTHAQSCVSALESRGLVVRGGGHGNRGVLPADSPTAERFVLLAKLSALATDRLRSLVEAAVA